MAQSGYTPILIYASGTASNVPLAANMTSSSSGAELALNYADGKLFYKDSGGVVQVLATKGAAQNSISFGSTGLTPSTATQGAVTVAGTLITSNGGTGLSSYTAGDLPYYASGTALSKLAIGTNGYILQSNGSAPTWVLASSVVGGAGGSNTQVQYNSSGSLAGSANMVFDGSTLTTLNSAYTGTLTGGTGVVNLGSGQFYKDASGNVGIGTAAPQIYTGYRGLTIDGSTGGNIDLRTNGTIALEIVANTSTETYIKNVSNTSMWFGTNNTERMRIDSSGNVGIGTNSPTYRLDVAQTSAGAVARFTCSNASGFGTAVFANNNGDVMSIGMAGTTAGNFTGLAYVSAGGAKPLIFGTNDIQRMQIDAIGNLGVAVTPNSWGSGYKVIQNSAGFYGNFNTGTIISGQNWYDTGAGSYIYSATSAASYYVQASGGHLWSSAPIGTAGTSASFTTILQIGGINNTLALQGASSVGGIGITFPATQNASSNANTLDDYEEGTWTPNQGSGLVVVGTFSSNGTYTKIGNQVTVYAQLAGSTSIAISAYSQLVSNLPFVTSGSFIFPVGGLITVTTFPGSLINTGGPSTTTLFSTTATSPSVFIAYSITYQTT